MTNPFKISSLFSSEISFQIICRPLCFINLVVYSVHQKRRCRLLRVSQHSGRSFRTNILLTTPPHSNIRDHTFNFHFPITLENVTILNSCKSETDLHILKSLYIYKNNPVLNSSQLERSSSLILSINDTFVSFRILLPHPLLFHSNVLPCMLIS